MNVPTSFGLLAVLRAPDLLHEHAVDLLDTWLEVKLSMLHRERKAARRECGRLAEKLHVSRLEIESLRTRVKELESGRHAQYVAETHRPV